MACNPGCSLPCCNLAADQRYLLMLYRLGRLKMSQLAEIIEAVEEGKVLFNTYNYHEGKFCPMAIAYECHRWYRTEGRPLPTDENVRAYIGEQVYPEPANMLKGVPGAFYHGNDAERKRDLLWLCRELIKSKL